MPWISPPSEVYGLNPIRSANGGSILSKYRAGPGILELEIMGGDGQNTSSVITTRGREASTLVSLKDALGFSLNYSVLESATLRAAYFRARTEIDITSRFYSSPSTFVGLSIPLDASFGQFYSVGGNLELGDFEIIGEWADREMSGTAFPTSKAFYVTGAYRLGSWLVHATYSSLFKNTGTFRPHPNANSGIVALLETEYSLTFGLNYQFYETIVAKFDISTNRKNYDDTSNNFKQTIFRTALDFVF